MRASLRLICTGLLLSCIAAAQPQDRQEIKNLSKKEAYQREFGEAFTFPLQVKIVLEKKGLHPNKIEAFEVHVAAEPLGEEKPEDGDTAAFKRLPEPVSQPKEKWFSRIDSSPLQLMRAKPLEKTVDDTQAWRDSVKIGDPPLPFYLSPNSQPNFTISSQVVMFQDDVMQLGDFAFQPSRPGLYRLSLLVSHLSRKTDTLITHVYFNCPSYKLTLKVENERLLHHINYQQIAIPLVTSVFFEKNSDFFSFNETDLSFRNVFIGAVASRMACNKYEAALPSIYDKGKENSEWGGKRAQELASRLQDATLKMAPNGENDCATEFIARPATECEWELYYKISTISPEDFSEENRSIPMQLALAAQRAVFAPLEVKTADKSDEVELTAGLTSGVFAAECVREAKVIVTNAAGATQSQAVAVANLPAIFSGQEKIYLNTPHMRAFLQHGKYRARLQMDVACPAHTDSSEEVAFEIESQKNVLRDEIFALNPFDEIRFSFALDSLRVESLANDFLQTVADTLLKYPTQQPPDALVFMSGHACHLGEIKSRFYNLGLSFGRALFLRDRFITALQKQDAKHGLEVTIGAELCDANPLVAQFFHNPAIDNTPNRCVAASNGKALLAGILNRCFEASDGKALRDSSATYLKRIAREKVRHFELSSDPNFPRSPGVPSSYIVRQRIEEIEHLLPRNLVTLVFKSGQRTVNVHVVSAGFGATVPFYRRFEIPDSTRQKFEKIGVTPPYDLYGDDRYPAGRFMNRRVEVNIIW